MLSFPALDVAIGLAFAYFILAIVCSAVNEAIASFGRWRAQELERGLWELLQDPAKGSAALDRLKEHPLIKPMLYPKNKDGAATSAPKKGSRLKTNRKTDLPSYIPSRTFVTALLGLEQRAVTVAKDVDIGDELRNVDESIRKIPSEPVQQALTSLLHGAQGDAVVFRRRVEQWYDDQMERVSGWYRKRIQKVLWLVALVLAFTINADSLQMAKRLWVEPSVRASLVSQARNASSRTAERTNATDELESLPVPLGWHLTTDSSDPQGFPFYAKWSVAWALVSKVIGLLLTVIAITFGAPFWFDTLSKLARLRNSGAPPPASDAVRHGEGEETRGGETARSRRRPRRG